jgi:hypothetical protein
MKSKDIIMASTEELKKLHIIKMFFEKKIRQKEAASLLDLSTRQIRRIAARVKLEGNKAVAHRLRQKPSNMKKSDFLKEKILNLYRAKYSDFGPTFAAEKLSGCDKIKIGKETLRIWLIEAGLHKKRRKPRPHRLYRDRKASFGEMAQVDGSEHAWFEDRGPKSSLIGCIDDATNNVFGRFYTHEGTIPALDCFYRYSLKYGLPVSVYIDKHTTYRSTAKPSIEEELGGEASQSQFQRALSQLGVKIIYANSPQAKGRIERLFETFQDRLVKELRLAGIDNINDANAFLEEYLPLHNKRFSLPSLSGIDMHRKPPANIKSILCIKNKRVLRNDNTISYCASLYQILDRTVAKKVDVEEHLDGNIYIKYNGKNLRYCKIESRPKLKEVKEEPKERIYSSPKPYHPWRGKMRGRGVLVSKI